MTSDELSLDRQKAECHAVSPGASRWRMVIHARVTNFGQLRRRLSRSDADGLATLLSHRINRMVMGARAVAIARDLIEIELEFSRRDMLDEAFESLVTHFDDPIGFGKESYRLNMTFGVAVGEDVCADELGLIERAEQALCRTNGQLRTVVHEVGSGAAEIDRAAMARDLDRALARGELFLHYQPKMNVRRQEITSVEALTRWNHPLCGLVPPGEFIPLAEETGAITELTLWTITQAIIDQAVLAEHGHDLRVFVNISGMMLSDSRFAADVTALLRGKAGKIGFEVTETSVIRDPESAIRHLEEFARIGVEIAIDDYGAGLSSLAYLKRLPARELKIDKLFITQLTSSNRDPLIVRSTIDLAHALEMEVVAEGVETPAALALLSVMGCDMVQGFLICRPITLRDLIRFLDSKGHAHAVGDSRATFGRLALAWQQS
ncbi:MAG TPA: EAL domain-containing protein [Sphingomonas sp.]|uniref:EAL domain-containing protein n=1 Tax=Sphingomonas sp. TaxID=28214 RepID=UPI002EDA5AA3